MGNREHIYEIIAGNIRKERRRLGMNKKFSNLKIKHKYSLFL